MSDETEIYVGRKTTLEVFVSDLSAQVRLLNESPTLVIGKTGEAFVALSPEMFEVVIDCLEDLEDLETIQSRMNDETVAVSLEDLRRL